MKLQDLKQYTLFLIIASLFIISIISSMVILLKLNGEVEEKAEENKTSLEINLPVIEWGKYDTLSKKYPDDKIK